MYSFFPKSFIFRDSIKNFQKVTYARNPLQHSSPLWGLTFVQRGCMINYFAMKMKLFSGAYTFAGQILLSKISSRNAISNMKFSVLQQGWFLANEQYYEYPLLQSQRTPLKEFLVGIDGNSTPYLNFRFLYQSNIPKVNIFSFELSVWKSDDFYIGVPDFR